MTSIIDTHCHLDDSRFDDDRDEVYTRAIDNGVCAIVVPAVTRARWADIEIVSNKYKNVFATAGLHPMFCQQHHKSDLDALERRLTNTANVAVGECGLDGSVKPSNLDVQKFFFEAQLELAKIFQLPVIIHARNAVEQVILALKHHRLCNPAGNGVIHSYNGSLQQAHTLIELGYKVSFGGPITYSRAQKLHTLVKQLPMDSIMLETDAPDQPSAEHHRQRNEPGHINSVLDAVATLRNETATDIARASNNNAQALFKLPQLA